MWMWSDQDFSKICTLKKKKTIFLPFNLSFWFRALTTVVLYYYILALQTPKSAPSSGAKSIFFSSIDIVHIYL